MKLRSFKNNKSAMVLPAIIAIVFIFFSSMIWLMGALIISLTHDNLASIIAVCDPRVGGVASNVLNAYGVCIIVVDVLLVVWWGLSAQRKESQEEPAWAT